MKRFFRYDSRPYTKQQDEAGKSESAEARKRMLERMGICEADTSAAAARENMIRRGQKGKNK